MTSKILSLNVSLPKSIEWNGKVSRTSMHKLSVPFLEVSSTSIVGDQFGNPKFHGKPDSVLYAFGVDAAEAYRSLLGRGPFAPGEIGENLTLETLDESQVSVGDIFKIGGVIAQATFPRIPCATINASLRHADGMKAMIALKRSGVYFRILQPGRIVQGDVFELSEKARVPFTIAEVYARMVGGVKVSTSDLERVLANGAFPMDRIAKWIAASRGSFES